MVRGRTGLDLSDDVTGWLGDASAYVAGTSPETIEFGLRAESTDPAGPRALLGAARKLIAREAPNAAIRPAAAGVEDGFAVSLPGGESLEAGVIGTELVVAAGRAAVDLLEPAQTLGDSERFRAAIEALGGEFEPSAYLDIPALLAVSEHGGGGDAAYAAAKPYLQRLSYAVAGSRFESGLAISRLVIGARGSSQRRQVWLACARCACHRRPPALSR